MIACKFVFVNQLIGNILRQGFGQQILRELETRAGARGYTTLHLHTSMVQIVEQKLYEKHGYHEVGREMYQQFEIILYEKA